MFIKRFIRDDIKIVPMGRIDILAGNKVDRERASKSPQIREAYAMALSLQERISEGFLILTSNKVNKLCN